MHLGSNDNKEWKLIKSSYFRIMLLQTMRGSMEKQTAMI